jgi:alpha-L-arabinofuranosidase
MVAGPTFGDDPDGARTDVPAVDAVASRSADGKRIYLKVVNTHPTRELDARVELRGATAGVGGEWELLAGAPQARNDFRTPEAIAPRRLPLRAGGTIALRLPARSVSVLTLQIGG